MDSGLTAGYRRTGWGNGRVTVVPAAAVAVQPRGDTGAKAQLCGRISVCIPFITSDAGQVQPVRPRRVAPRSGCFRRAVSSSAPPSCSVGYPLLKVSWLTFAHFRSFRSFITSGCTNVQQKGVAAQAGRLSPSRRSGGAGRRRAAVSSWPRHCPRRGRARRPGR